MIKREQYLTKIREFYHMDLIKVITGIRRCGKSVLLMQIMDELKEREFRKSRLFISILKIMIIHLSSPVRICMSISRRRLLRRKNIIYFWMRFRLFRILSASLIQFA